MTQVCPGCSKSRLKAETGGAIDPTRGLIKFFIFLKSISLEPTGRFHFFDGSMILKTTRINKESQFLEVNKRSGAAL